jgi:hypothetical protein
LRTELESKNTLPTFNWCGGMIFPGFGLVTLQYDTHNPTLSEVFVKECFLPPQLVFYLVYLGLFFITLILIFPAQRDLLHNQQYNKYKKRDEEKLAVEYFPASKDSKNSKNSLLKVYCGNFVLLLVTALPFYLFLLVIYL